ncbi:hypothetical protein PENSPDRAFT_747452 [Peniophora sp. CONT]|nr:hypothetical protein PENSPDRAFT_747452 [Peniophora sp. CONT]
MSQYTFGLNPFVVVPAAGTYNNVPQVPVIVPSPARFGALPFVWHIDVLLCVLFGIFVLSTLPRAVARYTAHGELFAGLYLRRGKPTNGARGAAIATVPAAGHAMPKTPVPEAAMMMHDGATVDDEGTMRLDAADAGLNEPAMPASSTTASHAALLNYAVVDSDNGARQAVNPPAHISSYLALTHPVISYVANFPVAAGLPFKHFAVLLIYFGILLYVGVRGTSPFTDPRRPVDVAISQLPFVLAFSQKNNVLAVLSGLGYEKLNYLHRFVGRIIVLGVNLHTSYYLYRWSLDGTIYAQSRTSFVVWGIIGTAAVDVLFLLSTAYVRARAYGLFLASHIFLSGLFVVAMYIHEPVTLPYFVTAFVLYGADHIFRAMRTRIVTVDLTAAPLLNGGSTIVSAPSLTTGWRAGQHVRMRIIPARGPRWLAVSWTWFAARFRARPFTISTRPGSSRGLELIVKKEGRSTQALFARATKDCPGSDGDPEKQCTGACVKATVLLEGPYSGPGHALPQAFSGALLLAGGSGITHALALLDALAEAHANGRSSCRVVDLVWATPDIASCVPLLPRFRELLAPRPSPHGSFMVRVSIHYTRVSSGAMKALNPAELPAGLVLHAGRPYVRTVLADACRATAAAHPGVRPRGLVVSTCGPAQISEQAHAAVGSIAWDHWREVGGIEIVSETFGM